MEDNITKSQPRETLKSLRVPSRYRADDTEENKIIYALSRIGEGGAEDIGIKISQLDTSVEPAGFSHVAGPILQQLYERGLIRYHIGKNNPGYYSIG